MKKIITSIAIVTLFTFYLTACKKSSDTQQPQTTLQKIQAKWQVDTYYENDHFSGADHIKNTVGTANDYFDFRPDGKIYFSLQELAGYCNIQLSYRYATFNRWFKQI